MTVGTVLIVTVVIVTLFRKTTLQIDNGWDVRRAAFCDSRDVFYWIFKPEFSHLMYALKKIYILYCRSIKWNFNYMDQWPMFLADIVNMNFFIPIQISIKADTGVSWSSCTFILWCPLCLQSSCPVSSWPGIHHCRDQIDSCCQWG